jgi:hypothetical protein
MTSLTQKPDVLIGMILDEANDYVNENVIRHRGYQIEYVTDNTHKDIRHERLQVALDNNDKITSFRY